jgi:tetratricopeptide (TPR) repeat protein/tRNA A-37 threonylcarbamoyl transferase component Bud32
VNAERWRQIEDIVQSALEQDPGARSAFLAAACGADDELRREVESLLGFEAQADGVLAGAVRDAAEQVAQDRSAAFEGQRIGVYHVLGEIGQGGMGTVLLADRDDDQFHKQVAIKLVTRGMDTTLVLERFRYERQILARLDHPYIARLLDGGVTEQGLPYLVMEYIEGVNIATYCSEHALGLPARIALFRKVCLAVQYAHQNLVVHRDLKPGNILVTEEATPKLLDFGIAKLVGPREGPQAMPATALQQMMTPDYASPEQVLGQPVTTATDVYSLGAILYELVTGVRAHQIKSYSPREIERTICEEAPPKPSAASSASPAGDLDNIILMAMQKEPGRRYGSVADFSSDLKRYLQGLPVKAREDTFGYRAGKFISRHKAGVLAAGALAATLVAAVTVTAISARRAERRFRQVQRIAHAVLYDIHDAIRDLPGSMQARQVVVKTALDYLDELSRDASGDRGLQRELAAAYARIGDVRGSPETSNLGDIAGALDSYGKARKLLDAALARAPGDRQAELERLKVIMQTGMVESQKVGSGAIDTSREGLRLAEAALVRYPGDLEFEDRLADLCQLASTVQRVSGDSNSALANASRGLELLLRLRSARPDDREIQRKLAAVYAQVGMAEVRLGQLKPALDHYRQNVAEAEALCLLDPANTSYRRALGMAYGHLGDVLGNPLLINLGDTEGALEAYGRLVQAMKKLYDTDPADQQAISDYGIGLWRMAVVMPPDRADEKLARLMESLEILTKAHPQNFEVVNNTVLVEELIGDMLAARGQRAEAVSLYRRGLTAVEALIASKPEHEGPHRQAVAVGRKLAEEEARAGKRGEALSILDRVLKIGAWAEQRRSTTARALAPRAYAAAGSVHALLKDPAAAHDWYQKAVTAWRALEHEPAFSAAYRKEMEAAARGTGW